MEKVDRATPFIEKFKDYDITVEIAITEETDAIDVNLYTYANGEFYDIMLATGPINEANKKEAERMQKYYAFKYGFEKVSTWD